MRATYRAKIVEVQQRWDSEVLSEYKASAANQLEELRQRQREEIIIAGQDGENSVQSPLLPVAERKRGRSLQKRLQLAQQRHLKEVNALEMKIGTNWTRLWGQRSKEIAVIRKQYLNAKSAADSRYRGQWQRLKRNSPTGTIVADYSF